MYRIVYFIPAGHATDQNGRLSVVSRGRWMVFENGTNPELNSSLTNLEVPSGLDDITPEWMTAALQRYGLDVEVSLVMPEEGAKGLGANGITCRLLLEYAHSAEGAPTSLVVKLPSTSATLKGNAIRMRLYHNEIKFYGDLADRVMVKTPHCYYSGIDDEQQNYALLIQDMTPAVVGNDARSCTKEEAILAVREISKLHAAWWNHPDLNSISWLPVAEANLPFTDKRFAKEVLPRLMNNYGKTLSPKVLGIIKRFCTNCRETILKMCSKPITLTHSDYRLTNMLFGGLPDASEITVIDWQRVAIARGPIDVAFFAVFGLTPELRRSWERELVGQYHDALIAEGVHDYSLEECWQDYRLCSIGPARIALAFASRPQDDIGGAHLLQLQQTLFSRVVTAMEDLGMEEFV